MSRLNTEMLDNMVLECEDFIRLASDRRNELTNEDLQIMLDTIKHIAQTHSHQLRYEMSH